MWSILFHSEPGDQDTLVTELWERGTAGIVEEGDRLRAFFDSQSAASQLLDAPGLQIIDFREERSGDDAAFEVRDWDGIEVGERFYIAPPWVTTPGPAGRIRLTVNSPRAFGTGRHETTQLCLAALEEYLKRGATVLDVGCGSGILSQAARLLGAGKVFTCDTHKDAIETAKAHGATGVFQGSADAVATGSVDVTVANISARVLDVLAADLRRVTKADGCLIVSGFVADRVPERFVPEVELKEGDWFCWICRPGGIRANAGEENSEGLLHSAEWWL